MKKLYRFLLLASAMIITAVIIVRIVDSRRLTKLAPLPTYQGITRACDVFTIEMAREYFSPNAQALGPGQSDSVITGRSITTCNYQTQQDQFGNAATASLRLYKSTPDDARAEFNKAMGSYPFTVLDMGDKAFWDATRGELHVLAQNYWLIVSSGQGPAEGRESADSEAIAKAVLNQLASL